MAVPTFSTSVLFNGCGVGDLPLSPMVLGWAPRTYFSPVVLATFSTYFSLMVVEWGPPPVLFMVLGWAPPAYFSLMLLTTFSTYFSLMRVGGHNYFSLMGWQSSLPTSLEWLWGVHFPPSLYGGGVGTISICLSLMVVATFSTYFSV